MPLRDHWRIAALLVAQFAILAAIPLRTLRTRAEGIDVTLWTQPVDPFDVLSGYHVTLGYEAEHAEVARDVQPGLSEGDELWVTVRRAEPAWTPVSITAERPAPAPDEISMRATWGRWQPRIVNAGRLYIPESQREDVAKVLDAVKGRALVDLRVDEDGDVAVLRLRAEGRVFGDDGAR